METGSLTIFKISEHQKVFIITHNHEIDEFILFVPEIRNALEHATRVSLKDNGQSIFIIRLGRGQIKRDVKFSLF